MLTKIYKNFFGILAKDKILFFGSGKVAHPTAVKLSQTYQNLQFVTHFTPERQKLTNQVEILCKEKNIFYSTPIKSKGDKAKIKQEWNSFANEIAEPDFGIVCSFGYMIPQPVINKFKKGMIVVHPSLLPKYRGGSPIFHAIANGQEKSGVSYIEISPGKFDSGNLLFQRQKPLSKTANYSEIEADLANFAAQNLMEVLENIEKLRPGTPQSELTLPQKQQYKLKAPIIKSKHLDFNQPAERVYNLSRAIGNPRVNFDGKDILLTFDSKYLEDEENSEVGKVKIKSKKMYIKCQDKYIRVQNWRQPSKKQCPTHFFVNQFLKGKDESTWPKFA